MPTVGLSPETEAKLARARLRWYRVCGLACVLTLVGVAYLAFDANNDNADAVKARRILLAQSELLVECTTAPEERKPPVDHPGPSDCYLRQEARSGQAIGGIQTYIVIASACGAANPGDVPRTRRCVEQAIAR